MDTTPDDITALADKMARCLYGFRISARTAPLVVKAYRVARDRTVAVRRSGLAATLPSSTLPMISDRLHAIA